jgi:signal transduction histidine kinase
MADSKKHPCFSITVLVSLPLLLVLFSCQKRDKEDLSSIKTIIDKAAVNSVNGNYALPLIYLDSALAGKRLSLREKIEVLGFIGDVYNNQLHNYEKANLYADSMLKLVEAAGPEKFKREYALSNYNKGDVLFNLKQYNEAYNYYYKARAIGQTSLDSCTLAEYSFRLALVLYRQSRFAEAAIVFQRSYLESRSCQLDFGKYYRMQQVLNNTGLSYYKAGNYDSALFYYSNAVELIKQEGKRFPERNNLNDVAIAVVYGNMADIYSLTGNTLQAKQLLKYSIFINSKTGNDNRDAQYSQVKLAEIFYDQGDLDSSYSVLVDLRRGLDTINNMRAAMDWNRLMWKYYDKTDSKTAYTHLVNFTVLRDSLDKESAKLKSVDLSQQIKILETQYQIQSLQKDNQIKNAYLWVAVVASLLAIIILFFIFRNLIKSRKNVQLLQSLNDTVNEQKLQLQQALTTVEDKNRQQERILRAVAHDLRAPIATISMLSDLVIQEENKDSRLEMLNFIKASCNNSLELIAEILEAADQSKRKEQEKESVSINNLVKNVADISKLKASEKQQTITCELPKQELFLMVNPEKIKRVIGNLVTNAIKFSAKGGKIKIKLVTDEDGGIISVEDNGIGIPSNIEEKVFDMFTEAKRKGTAGELPYGLGLSICKQIVDAHNGKIWLVSKEGVGTTFFVKLPV